MRFWKCLLLVLAPTLCVAAQSDRITGPIDSSQMVTLKGNVHGLAQPQFDLGRSDGSMVIHGVTLAFRPSAAQQKDLDNLLAQQQDRSSPNYHKWLTPAQFADRFGMSRNDVARVVTWLESQGFTVVSIANSHNQISFDGTVAQVESAFGTEIHNYLVDSEIHFANATNPSVPAALAGLVLAVGHLHDFRPKARIRAQSHFTSATSGNHFLSPGDFATIYDLQPLYSAGIDGTGQTIAIAGQTAIYTSDIDNFRNAAGLTTKEPTQVLVPNSGTSAVSTSDLLEADLDLEWSNGVAKNAAVVYVYVGNSTSYSVWDSLHYAVQNKSAPVISISYGFCEALLPAGFPQTVQGWAQQANSQGQTIVSASGDAGAADCDGAVPSATKGLAVDVPAAIPEVTGMGGNEFFGDAASTSTTTYWNATGASDDISSAISYIPEEGWNDTVAKGSLSASGGGASIFFAKPAWQAGTGVPQDGQRDVPDLALSASPDHDGYLICSQNDGAGNPSCTQGFRDSSTQGYLDVVGGTSAAAPTFAGIVALLNQYLGASGLGNINPNLYSLAASSAGAFHDVTTGDNIVPCTGGTTDCPTGTVHFGFTAGVGYDQVTGLGSVDSFALAKAWGASRTATATVISTTSTTVTEGTSVTFTATVTPSATTGKVTFYNNGWTTALGTATLSNGTATLVTSALSPGSNSVMATYYGNKLNNTSTSASGATVTVTVPFTLLPTPPTLSISAGQTIASTITITPVNGFTGAVSFTNSTASSPGSCTANLPAGALCSFNPGSVTLDGVHSQNVVLTISTAPNMAPTSGAQSVTVTGTSGGSISTTTVNLTVTATTENFTLTTNAKLFAVAVGGTAQVPVTVNSLTGFIVGSGSSTTTALPLTYSCSGIPVTAEISCQLPNNGQPTNATSVTVSLATTPVTTQLRPLGGSRIFYALLLPGLFGVVFAAGSRARGLRLLSLTVVLGLSTIWMGCGGSSNVLKNPGTPAGIYAVTVNATTGGTNPVTGSVTFSLNVTTQ